MAVRNLSLEKLFFGCGNILPKLELNILVMVRIFNIAATPQGGSDLINAHHVSRGRGSLRSPHPLAMFPEPPRGFLLSSRLGRALFLSLCDAVLSEPH